MICLSLPAIDPGKPSLRNALIVSGFIAAVAIGAGIARAIYAWERIPTPCVPSGVAMTAAEIVVICPGDRNVYVQPR